jgi:hypothetical protein
MKTFGGFLFFNFSSYSKAIQINPVVGVHFSQLEQEIARLCARKYSPNTPSISTTVHHLLGKESIPRWDFDETLDVQAQRSTVASMVDTIKTVGIPYIMAHSLLEKLPDALLPWKNDAYGTHYRVPVLLAMLGRTDEARSFVENKVRGFPTMVNEGTFYAAYIAFANRFNAHLDAGRFDGA